MGTSLSLMNAISCGVLGDSNQLNHVSLEHDGVTMKLGSNNNTVMNEEEQKDQEKKTKTNNANKISNGNTENSTNTTTTTKSVLRDKTTTSAESTASQPQQLNNVQKQPNKKLLEKAGPWVEEDRSQSDPLPLVNESDVRPSTRDLILKHLPQIKAVQQELSQQSPHYHPAKHDALWVLRYLISQNNSVPKATAAAIEFMEYRARLKLDESDIRHDPPGKNCSILGVRQYYDCLAEDAMIFCVPDKRRGICIFARLAGFDQTKLINTVSQENWPFWYFMEWSFQMLDSITRKSGRLTKGIRIVDLHNYSLSQNNKAHLDRSADNAKSVQDQYPQMLASVFVVNAPSFFSMAFRIVKPLLPKRFVEKFDILPNNSHSEKNKKRDSSSCTMNKRLLAHVAKEHFPRKFGGDFEEWPYPTGILSSKVEV